MKIGSAENNKMYWCENAACDDERLIGWWSQKPTSITLAVLSAALSVVALIGFYCDPSYRGPDGLDVEILEAYAVGLVTINCTGFLTRSPIGGIYAFFVSLFYAYIDGAGYFFRQAHHVADVGPGNAAFQGIFIYAFGAGAVVIAVLGLGARLINRGRGKT